jgi:hypothetical protein
MTAEQRTGPPRLQAQPGSLAERYQAKAAANPGGRSFAPSRPHRAAGTRAPGVGPVVAFTFFFGLFGVISAARRANRARLIGAPAGPYWTAFAVTTVVTWVLWGTLVAGAYLAGLPVLP